MGVRYVEVSSQDVAAVLGVMGFERKYGELGWNGEPILEEIWVRDISARGVDFPYQIKIFTSVDVRSGKTRDCGNDAIRLVLMDKVTGHAVKAHEKRVYRTNGSMERMKERARDLYMEVLKAPKCSKCGAIMVERCSKKPGSKPFMSCSHWAPGKDYHCA